ASSDSESRELPKDQGKLADRSRGSIPIDKTPTTIRPVKENSWAALLVQYLSTFDFFALRSGFICSPSIDPLKWLVTSL
ncbi:MAG: hypothetical protein ACK5N9_16590, partial [Pirellula sp.]